MQISNQPLCHEGNCCFAQIRGLAPAQRAGKRLERGCCGKEPGCGERGDSGNGRGCCWDHCGARLIASSVTPKVEGVCGGIC